MEYILLPCLLFLSAISALGGVEKASSEYVIIIDKEITSSESEIPEWINAFDREVVGYDYTPEQSSLAKLRATGVGNCVAFAKAGAWHALRDGYQCRVIGIAGGTRKHMFLYATKGDVTWAVSNKSRREVGSIGDAMMRIGAMGCQIVIDQIITPDNIDSVDGSYLWINIPKTHSFRDQNEMERRIDFNSPHKEYNFR